MPKKSHILLFLVFALTPGAVWACACGCGVFGVGSAFLLPEQDEGGMVYFEYNFMDQTQNWSGTAPAPAANNSDKDIRTSFYNMGLMYTVNQDWTAMVNVPYWNRSFTTEVSPGDVETFGHGSVGDIRLMSIYTGFSSDMSTGVIVGLKLPTGDWTYPNFDRDTEIGTGSTDLMLGIYHVGKFDDAPDFHWFATGVCETAFTTKDGYRPGDEADVAAGLYYEAKDLGPFSKVVPLLQMIGSFRDPDTGSNADPDNTGYARMILSPGLEVDLGRFKAYADAEFPVWQCYVGNQLSAPVLVKTVVAYSF